MLQRRSCQPASIQRHLAARRPCSNQYIEALGKLDGVKDNMVGGGLPVDLAVELLRWVAMAPSFWGCLV